MTKNCWIFLIYSAKLCMFNDKNPSFFARMSQIFKQSLEIWWNLVVVHKIFVFKILREDSQTALQNSLAAMGRRGEWPRKRNDWEQLQCQREEKGRWWACETESPSQQEWGRIQNDKAAQSYTQFGNPILRNSIRIFLRHSLHSAFWARILVVAVAPRSTICIFACMYVVLVETVQRMLCLPTQKPWIET